MENEILEVSILYVEDDPLTRQVMARMLKRKAAVVYLAENGREGLDLFMQHRPDIVISDIKMPVMDGIEMSKEIKALDINSRIILTTAHSDANFLLNSIEVGIDRYLLKPVEIKTLLAALAKCAESVTLEKKIRERDREKDELIARLREALDNVKTLSGLIPICPGCRKIRDDKRYLDQLEAYLAGHSDALFNNGVCDGCLTKQSPDKTEGVKNMREAENTD